MHKRVSISTISSSAGLRLVYIIVAPNLVLFIKQIILKVQEKHGFNQSWIEAQKEIPTQSHNSYEECERNTSKKDIYMYVLLNRDQVEDLKQLKIKVWFWLS